MSTSEYGPIGTRGTAPEAQELSRPDLAHPVTPPTVANPAPLGLAAFATTTMVLSAFNAHLLSGAAVGVVLPLALFYGGLAQFLAGMWEFRAGNTFGATAFTSYGAFWLSFYGIFKLNVPIAGTDAHNAIGLYLLMWGIVTLYLLIASLRTNAAVAVVFLTLTITFFLLAIGEFQTAGKAATYVSSWTKIGGYLGIITAACAYYASFAEVTNATWGRTVLPVVPMTANRPALAMGRRRA